LFVVAEFVDGDIRAVAILVEVDGERPAVQRQPSDLALQALPARPPRDQAADVRAMVIGEEIERVSPGRRGHAGIGVWIRIRPEARERALAPARAARIGHAERRWGRIPEPGMALPRQKRAQRAHEQAKTPRTNSEFHEVTPPAAWNDRPHDDRELPD